MKQFISLVLTMAKTRFAIASLELKEARKRIFFFYVLSLGVLLLALLCLLTLTVLLGVVLQPFFSLERILLSLVVLYFLLTAGGFCYLLCIVRRNVGWFAATKAELAKDYEILRKVKE